MVGKGVISIFQGGISGARWAAGQVKSSVQQDRASGSQCQGRSVWHRAALWCVELGCLSSGLEPASLISSKWCTPHSWVFLINVLAPPMASVEFAWELMGGTRLLCLTSLLGSGGCPQGAVYRWSRSADKTTLTTGADILSVSPCQMCPL